ncbi:putative DNA binding protein [Campylobacter avium LMG 24591]|uniref:Putative DNA binding protein n=1 Tax=Campylobacter avium LMG 24591 TaxID=522484 RepID=A0A222MYV6_9BACT|nr:CopG family transcriptional regulator [Campylobacter avium]ASQ31029.1 putative DNA binding protein [Campylobacter avium LMG 24591]OYD78411.1 putative DNA binding protein [Campylobacter avium]HJE65577.1 CopG family transcriptional regulator [Campylobacter avium]
MKKQVKSVSCSFKIPAELKQSLDTLSKNTERTKTSIIIEALQLYIANNEKDDFSFAIDALEELKSGNYKKADKKLDDVIKQLKQ